MNDGIEKEGEYGMKKVFRMEDLECANCAAKMEEAIGRLDGVQSASVSFMAQKLTISVEDHLFDAVLEQAQKIVSKIEPDCVIVR